jgi:hypothetical protein
MECFLCQKYAGQGRDLLFALCQGVPTSSQFTGLQVLVMVGPDKAHPNFFRATLFLCGLLNSSQ